MQDLRFPGQGTGIKPVPPAGNPPVKFGERTRDCSPGQAGKEGPHLFDGGILWFFSNCGATVGFLTRYDGQLREPLMWRQGSQVSMRMARGSVSLLSSHGRGIRPQDALKTDS